MTVSFLHAVWTVLLFAVFVGIAVWAYLSRNKARFEEAASIPFDDGPFDGGPFDGGDNAPGVAPNRNRRDD
jgi:cytochrome c oxidase cbb3-type subunit 4